MKKTMLLMLPLFVALMAIAQPAHPGGKPRKGHSAKARKEMFKDLNLSTEQKAAIQKLQDEMRLQMKELNSNESITVKEQRDRREALLKTHKQAVESLLTPAQKEQLAQHKAAMLAKAAVRHEKQLDEMKEKLQLSAAQMEKIKDSYTAFQKQMDALRNNEKLSRQERKAGMDKLKTAHEQTMASILNADQLKQWKEMRQHEPRPGIHPKRGHGKMPGGNRPQGPAAAGK